MIHEYSQITGISIDDLLGRCKKKKIAVARFVYWYLLHEIGFSYAAIGRLNEREASAARASVIKTEWALKHNDSDTVEIVDKTKHLVEIYKKVKL